MFLKTVFLIFFGLCAGGVIAAGVYAFLAIIGVFVRLMGRTGTKNKVLLYESFIMAGGSLEIALISMNSPFPWAVLPELSFWVLPAFR